MKGKMKFLFLLFFLVGPGHGFATTFLQFDSTILGDGWFQYRMQVMRDPFFTWAGIPQLALNFTNQIDSNVNSQNWTNSSDDVFSSWFWTNSQSYPERPFEQTFLMRSAETSFRLGTNAYDAGIVVVYLSYIQASPYYTGNESVGGYARLTCLIPCSPEQADGSPTNFSFTLKLIPDVTIQSLVQSNGLFYDVDFLWASSSTLLLQASSDMTTWTNIAYVWSSPPETIWTTNRPLNDFGTFFRLQLVANGHVTNPPPSGQSILSNKSVPPTELPSATESPHVTGCELHGKVIAVNISTVANQKCTVTALDNRGVILATRQLLPNTTKPTVYFEASSLPAPVFFRVATSDSP